jgi:hypothetical protein
VSSQRNTPKLAARITQAVEGHQAQTTQNIDLGFGAAPRAGQAIKAQRAPEFGQCPHVTGMAAIGKAQAIQRRWCGRNSTGALERGNQGVNFAAVFQAAQGADGALAGFAIFISKGLDQLGVAPGAGLSDFDEHGASVT